MTSANQQELVTPMGSSSTSGPRVLIRAFRAYILPKKQSRYSKIDIGVDPNTQSCDVKDDVVDQDFGGKIEVFPGSLITIAYKSTKGWLTKKHEITISHGVLNEFLKHGGTEFYIFNDSGTFMLNLEPCMPEFLIRPNLLIDSISEHGRDNRDLDERLREGGEMALRRITILERLGQGTIFLNTLKAASDLVSEIHPVIGAVVSSLKILIEIVEKEDKLKEDILLLIDNTSYMVTYCSKLDSHATQSLLKESITEMETLAKEVVEFVKKWCNTNRAVTLFFGDQDGVKGLEGRLSGLKQKIDDGIKLELLQAKTGEHHADNTTVHVQQTILTNEDDAILIRLNPRISTRTQPPRCFKGTRGTLRSEIKVWSSLITYPNILWINGHPGAGKSTVAFQIDTDLRLSDEKYTVFMFDFDRKSKTSTRVALCTFAYDLAHAFPACKSAIVSTLNGTTFKLGNATTEEIFRNLIHDPLERLHVTNPPDKPLIFIVDALDECGNLDGSANSDRKELLAIINVWAQLSPNFRLIVTSRVESDIRDAFSEIGHTPLEILTGAKVTKESTSDIELYVQEELRDIANHYKFSSEWPGSVVVEELANRAGGIFIWAVTALKYIRGPGPETPSVRLQIVRNGTFPTGDVYALYREILERSFPERWQSQLFVRLASAVIAAQSHLTPEDWACLLNCEPSVVRYFHSMLSTVVDDGDAIRFHHQSFVDFLLGGRDSSPAGVSDNQTRCPQHFRVNIPDAECTLTRASFFLMNSELHFNSCNIPSSYLANSTIPLQDRKKAIGPALAYACEFWPFHIQRQTQSRVDMRWTILRFLQEKCLYWLEGLSYLGALSIAVDALNAIQRYFKTINGKCTDNRNMFMETVSRLYLIMVENVDTEQSLYKYSVAPLVRDSTKFIQYFYPAISVNAAHIYISALPFSPCSSRLSHIYASKFKNVLTVDIGRLLDWPAEQIVIRGSHRFTCAVFSHNSNLIASGSIGGSVEIWDSGTGELVVGPLLGHTERVTAIAFSLDNRRVVSGSADKTILIWEVETGTILVGPLTGHNDWVMSVAISRDGKFIASRSLDGEIRIWNVEHGGTTNDSHVLRKHDAEIVSVTFSSNDKHVISGSRDNKVSVWNVRSGALVAGPFYCHARYFCTVPISIDSRHVVAGTGDDAVPVWNVESKKVVGEPFQRHKNLDASRSCSFSRDGTRAALCSGDKSVRVCDVKTGKTIAGPFRGHAQEYGAYSVSFSHDDKRVLSRSIDGTIRIWDSEAGENVQDTFQGHTTVVNCVALSNDGKWIVSGSHDKTIRLREMSTGKMVGLPLEGHENWVVCVAFSADGKRVVSGSWDKTIRVWSTKTGKCLFTKRHKEKVRSVAFSYDGRRVVSGSFDMTIRIWNADTGDLILDISGHEGRVFSVAFSHDDTRVVSGSSDKTIRIWNAETGEMIGNPFTGHQGSVYSVAFSHDSKLIVSGSHDKTVRIWSVETGEMVAGPFRGHEDRVLSVAFSPDDKLVVSGSFDRTIRVWNIESAETVIGPLKGHEGPVPSVAISNDGHHVVSCSYDSTIRVWDLKKLHGPFTHDEQVPDKDGWVKGESGELLFWVPRIHRRSFYALRSLIVIGQHQTRVNYSHVQLGEDWERCYSLGRCS